MVVKNMRIRFKTNSELKRDAIGIYKEIQNLNGFQWFCMEMIFLIGVLLGTLV
jgi:hypothetical protein